MPERPSEVGLVDATPRHIELASLEAVVPSHASPLLAPYREPPPPQIPGPIGRQDSTASSSSQGTLIPEKTAEVIYVRPSGDPASTEKSKHELPRKAKYTQQEVAVPASLDKEVHVERDKVVPKLRTYQEADGQSATVVAGYGEVNPAGVSTPRLVPKRPAPPPPPAGAATSRLGPLPPIKPVPGLPHQLFCTTAEGADDGGQRVPPAGDSDSDTVTDSDDFLTPRIETKSKRSHSLTTVKSDDSTRQVPPPPSSYEYRECDDLPEQSEGGYPAYVRTVTEWLRTGRGSHLSSRGRSTLYTSDSDIVIQHGSPPPSDLQSDSSLPAPYKPAAAGNHLRITVRDRLQRHLDISDDLLAQLPPGVASSSDSEEEDSLPRPPRPERKGKHVTIRTPKPVIKGGPRTGLRGLGRSQSVAVRPVSNMEMVPEVPKRRPSMLGEGGKKVKLPPPEMGDLFTMLHTVVPKSPPSPRLKHKPPKVTATATQAEGGRKRRSRTISVTSSEGEEVISLPLSQVDFMPEQLGTLTYERFEVLVARANDWLAANQDCRTLSCETIELSRDDSDTCYLDPDQSVFHQGGATRRNYLWGLRVWLVPKSIADPRKSQRIGYHNVFPALRKRGDAFQCHTYDSFDDLMANVNHTLRTKAKGRVLNIHVAPVKVKDASRGLDPDLTYWSALEKYGVQYLHMARIFYEKGVPQKLKIEYIDFVPYEMRGGSVLAEPIYENFFTLMAKARHWLHQQRQVRVVSMQSVSYQLRERVLDTQQTVFHQPGKGATQHVRILRLFYMRPLEGGFVKSYTPTLSYRTFLPAMTRKPGLLSGPRYECLSDTIDRAAAWLYVTGVRVLAAETLPLRLVGTQAEREATYSCRQSEERRTWLHAIRLYLDGDYQEPEVDELPPLPVPRGGTCVCTIL